VHVVSLGLTHDDPPLLDPSHENPSIDHPASSHRPGEVYGLSKLRRSQRIAKRVETIGQQRWGSNGLADIGGESDEEELEEDDTEDELIGDFDINVASDEGLEGYEDDDDEMFAGSGQEGISLWDSLGEGFLKEVSQLGMSLCYCYFQENYNSFSRGKAFR
jgi:hypothetical protein